MRILRLLIFGIILTLLVSNSGNTVYATISYPIVTNIGEYTADFHVDGDTVSHRYVLDVSDPSHTMHYIYTSETLPITATNLAPGYPHSYQLIGYKNLNGNEVESFHYYGVVRALPEGYTTTASIDLTTVGCTVIAVDQDGNPAPFNPGDVITLTATASGGYFQNPITWTGATPDGDPAVSNTATISIPDAPLTEHLTLTVTARCQPNTHTIYIWEYVDSVLTVAITGAAKYSIPHGAYPTITVPEKPGYRFTSFNFNGGDYPVNSLSFVVGPITNSSVIISYWAKETIITGKSQGFGTVTPASIDLLKGQTGLVGYTNTEDTEDESATLTATNSAYGTFDHWLKDDVNIGQGILTETGSTLNVTYTDGPATYTGVFITNPCSSVTTSVYSADGVSNNTASISLNSSTGREYPSDSSSFTVGSELTLSALSDSTHSFLEWRLDGPEGPVVSTDSTTTITVTNTSAIYYAIFEDGWYNTTTSVYSADGVTDNTASIALNTSTGLEYPSNSSSFSAGSELILSALSDSTHSFLEWRLGGLEGPIVSTDPTTTITVTNTSAIYYAIFEEDWYNITASPNISSRGSVTVSEASVLHHTSTTITATSSTNCFFEKYINTTTGITIGTTATLVFSPTSDINITAIFGTNPIKKDPIVSSPETTPNSGNRNDTNAQTGENNNTDDIINHLDSDDNQGNNDHILPVTDLSDSNEPTLDSPSEIAETGDTTDSVEGTPIPQTSGVLIGILFVIGLSITGLGIKIKKSKNH